MQPLDERFEERSVDASSDSDIKLVSAFRAAVEGLYYLSETDRPFEVKISESSELTPENLVEQRKAQKGTQENPVEARSLNVWFERLTREQDWHNDHERAIAHRFRALHGLITQHLTDTAVYRIGEIDIDIYIVGRSSSGRWVVLSTSAVET